MNVVSLLELNNIIIQTLYFNMTIFFCNEIVFIFLDGAILFIHSINTVCVP